MLKPVKAFSLWEPWALLCALAEKGFETRSWFTNYRGPLVIHAAKRWTDAEKAYCRLSPFREVLAKHQITALNQIPLGKALCVVDLTACLPTEDIWRDISNQERAFGNYQPGRWAWKLENVRRLGTPISIQGAQGLWDWPANIPLLFN